MDDTAIFPKIQVHPYPLQTQNPVEGMDGIAIFIENPESSIMQNEKKSGQKSDTIHRGGGTDIKWNGPLRYSPCKRHGFIISDQIILLFVINFRCYSYINFFLFHNA